MTVTARAPDRLIAPFRGLAPFDESELDALLFFGRETETEIAVANLLAARLTILYGPSGVGKSSLLRAGVARRIRELAGRRAIGRGPDGAVVVVSAWADEPVATITAAIASEVTSLVKRPVTPPPAGLSLAGSVDYWSTVLDGHLYLVLDQLEEHFAYHGDEQRPGSLIDELPEVVLRPRLRANVLLSLRDDALAQLDVFKGSIPNLFANYLRLDRLDRGAATAAILGPVKRWNDLVPAAGRVDVEPALVDVVLAQAAVAGDPDRIEPPYLQLVMERVWNAEHDAGSRELRASTLLELGGAGAIVREHLDRALAVLEAPEQDAAALMFEHLVTPSGTKVAHRASDLAEFAHVPVASVTPMLATLGRERILRSLDEGSGAGDRYEIFHDVLADAILGWRRRRNLERERQAAHTRQRRLVAIAAGALTLAAVMVGVTLYALSARSNARHQAAVANHERSVAESTSARNLALLDQAERAKRRYQTLKREADLGKASEHRARLKALADEQKLRVATQKLAAQDARLSSSLQEKTALLAQVKRLLTQVSKDRAQAVSLAARYLRERNTADRARNTADRLLARVRKDEQVAVARQKEFDALALLTTDPQRSLELGVEASKVDRSQLDERVLRNGLLASHELRSIALGGPAAALSVSADGTRGAVATTGRAVAVIDLVGERRLAQFSAGAQLRAVAIAPDGQTVATGDAAGKVTLWSATGRSLRTMSAHGAVNALAFSPDGRVLAASGQDQLVLLFDPSTGGLLHAPSAGVVVQSLVFSPDGRRLLALGRPKTMPVIDVASGTELYPLTQVGSPRAAAFSPDGSTLVTAGADQNAYEWSAADGSLLRKLPVAGTVTAVGFAPDGNSFATAGTDSTARLWNTKTGAPQEFLTAHTAPVESVAFSRDGQLVITASADGTARIWASGDGVTREALLGHDGGVVAAGFLPGAHRAVTASSDGTVKFWDAQFDPPMRTVGVHTGRATGVVFLDRTTAASAGSDGVVRIWNVARRRPVRRLSAGVALTDVAATTGGTLVAASASDGRVFVWRAGGAPVTTLTVPAPARSVAFSPDGRLLVVAAGDRTARVLRLANGSVAATLHHAAAVNDAAFSPDGTLIASASADGLVRLWRATDGKLLATLEGHDASVLSVVFSHDGRLLLSASLDHDLRIWDVAHRTTLRVLRGHVALVSGGAFSADDRWVASAGPTKVGVWAVEGNDFRDDRLFYLDGSTSPLSAVAFSPSGNEIVSAGQDGAVRAYTCTVCGGLDQLVALARSRLALLGRG